MAQATYRAAIIGLGSIATDLPDPASDSVLGTAVRYSHASAMAAIPAINVVAACDIVADARARFVERWSKAWPEVRLYEDYREMLEREKPDLVSVATPDHLHADPVLGAVRAGARMIFCEKPLATSIEDADRMIEAVNTAGIAMTVNFTRRWSPEFAEARRMIRAGSIGRLTQIVILHGGARAMLFRTHGHVIDAAVYFAESDAEWVMGELESGFTAYGTSYRGDGGYDPATEPGMNCYIAFRNGVRAYIMGMKESTDELRLDLIGSRGRITLGVEGMRLLTTESPDPRFKPPITRVEFPSPRWSVSGIDAALRDLIESYEAHRPCLSPPESARHGVALTAAVLESQAKGNGPVRISNRGSSGAPV